MHLRPLDRTDVELAASWLSEKENHQWLDFGCGRQILSAAAIALMRQRDRHNLQLFAAEEGASPIGLVALSDINKPFKSATLWYVLGDKRYRGLGHTSRAVAPMLDIGFQQLGLESINAWYFATSGPR